MARLEISEMFSQKVVCPVCRSEEMFGNKVEMNRIIRHHAKNCDVRYDLAFEIKSYVIVRSV